MTHHVDQDQERQGNSFMLGLMAGTAIGAGMALLFAPREGSELRRELANGASRLGEQINQGTGTVRESARRAADSASDLIERGKSAYRDASSDVRDSADKVASQAESAVDSAAESAKRNVRQTASAVDSAANRAQNHRP